MAKLEILYLFRQFLFSFYSNHTHKSSIIWIPPKLRLVLCTNNGMDQEYEGWTFSLPQGLGAAFATEDLPLES